MRIDFVNFFKSPIFWEHGSTGAREIGNFKTRYGVYQGPDSIHTATARMFGSDLMGGEDLPIEFESEESVLDRDLKSGELPKMVESGELDLCYIS